MCVCSLQFTLVLRCLSVCLFKVDTSCGEPGLIKHLEISDIEDVQQEPGSQGGIAYALRDFGHLHCLLAQNMSVVSLGSVGGEMLGAVGQRQRF